MSCLDLSAVQTLCSDKERITGYEIERLVAPSDFRPFFYFKD
jgi:hypothetical protein